MITRGLFSLALFLIITQASSAGAQVAAVDTAGTLGFTLNPVTGIQYKAACTERPKAGDWTSAIPGDGTQAQDVVMSLRVADDQYHLATQLGISASMRFSSGANTVKASASFNESRDVTSYTRTASLITDVHNATRNLHRVRFTPEALRIRNPNAFVAACGSHFVSSVTTGGRFGATINISTSNSAQERTVAAFLSGKTLTFSGQAEARSVLQELRRSSNIAIGVTRLGDYGALPSGDSALIAYAWEFPKRVMNDSGPAVLVEGLTPLTSAIGFGSLAPAVQSRLVQLAHPNSHQLQLDAIARQLSVVEQIRNNLNYVAAHPERFDTTQYNLQTQLEKAERQVESLKEQGAACMEKGGSACGIKAREAIEPPPALCFEQEHAARGGTVHACQGAIIWRLTNIVRPEADHPQWRATFNVRAGVHAFELSLIPQGHSCLVSSGSTWYRFKFYNGHPGNPDVNMIGVEVAQLRPFTDHAGGECDPRQRVPAGTLLRPRT